MFSGPEKQRGITMLFIEEIIETIEIIKEIYKRNHPTRLRGKPPYQKGLPIQNVLRTLFCLSVLKSVNLKIKVKNVVVFK